MVGRSYVGNDVTHSPLLDRACACSYKNLPKYRSYRVSNTAQVFKRAGCQFKKMAFSAQRSMIKKALMTVVSAFFIDIFMITLW